MTQDYNVSVSMNQAALVKTGLILKQGDFGFNLNITVLDFDVSGATRRIIFRKESGAVESTNITKSGNTFTYVMQGTELDTPGKVICDLKLMDSTTKRISTASFMFEVIADTMDGLNQRAGSYSDTIEQIISGYEEDVDKINAVIDYNSNTILNALNDTTGKSFMEYWTVGQINPSTGQPYSSTSLIWGYTPLIIIKTLSNISINATGFRGYIYQYNIDQGFISRIGISDTSTLDSLDPATAYIRLALRYKTDGLDFDTSAAKAIYITYETDITALKGTVTSGLSELNSKIADANDAINSNGNTILNVLNNTTGKSFMEYWTVGQIDSTTGKPSSLLNLIWGYTPLLIVKTLRNIIVNATGFRGYAYQYDINRQFISRISIGSASALDNLDSATEYIRLNMRYTQDDINFDPVAAKAIYITYSTDITELNAEVQDFDYILSKNRNYYGSTPFYNIDVPLNKRQKRYNRNGSSIESSSLNYCSNIMKCPKVLGVQLTGADSRVFLYIGDMVDGQFVLDEGYIFSEGTYINYLSLANNQFIEINEDKYFYYGGLIGTVEIIGCDSAFPVNKYQYFAFDPRGYNPTSGNHSNSVQTNSLFLPHGSFYALKGNSNFYYYDPVKEEIIQNKIFGYVPEDTASVELTFIGTTNPIDGVSLYCSKKPSNISNHAAYQGHILGEKITKEFSFTNVKEAYYPGSNTLKYYVGKKYYGVPYSSRWVDSHFLFFEISPHTFQNASKDEFSIYYNSEIIREGGLAYGLVCSAFNTLLAGNLYPQANAAFLYDSNFVKYVKNHADPGDIFTSISNGHCIWIDAVFSDGYVTFEGLTPVICQNIHDTDITGGFQNNKTNVNAHYNYDFVSQPKERKGYSDYYLDFDVTITGGSVRPYKGDKCVLGSYDKENGIFATIHYPESGSLTTVYIKDPSNQTTSIAVTDETVIDISEYVIDDGTYYLWSDYSDVMESFRYFDKGTITLSFDDDGTAIFSDPDIEYAYCRFQGFPDEWKYLEDNNSHAICVAAGIKYPGLNGNITEVNAAIARDKTTNDSWGKYSNLCEMDSE